MNRRWSFFMIVRSEATARDLAALTIGAALLLALLGALAFQAPAQAQTTCTPNTGAGEFWCGVVTVGEVLSFSVATADGFFEPQNAGGLSDEDFDLRGNRYTIDGVTVRRAGTTNAEDLSFNLDDSASDNDGVLTDEEEDILVLYIGSDEYKFSDATNPVGVPNQYVWSSTGLDWSSETEVTLRLADLGPAAPAGFTAEPGNAQVELSWTAPIAGITRHEYRYRTSGDYPATWTQIANSGAGGANEDGFTVTGLTNETAYTFQLRAVSVKNSATTLTGAAAEAGPVTPKVPNNAPEFSDATATRVVAENPGAGTRVGGPVTASDADNDTLTYTLEGTDAASFVIVSASGQITTVAGVTYNFEAQSSYLVTVKADDGKGGTDTIDVTISLTDVEEQSAKPDKPTLAAVEGSSTSLTATWEEPDLNGGPDIQAYELRYRQGTSGVWADLASFITGTSTTISGLTPDTEYQAQVRAFNGESESDWSNSSDAVSTNAELAPTITRVAVTSVPLLTSSGGSTPDTYGADEDIEFSVTFSAAVEVAGDPQFGFSLAGARVADYASGSDSATLRFVYTVQPTDRDDNGIWVGNHATGNATLQLDADDAITSLEGTDDANLEHTALEVLPGHKVDGSRTAVPATPVAVTLHLSDADGEVAEGAGPVTVTATASPASAAAFTVTVSASAVGPATDDDFELSSNRVLSFGANATDSAGTVTIAPVDDGDPEPNQVVTVSGSASIADVIGPGDVTLTIRDDDLIRISGICNRTQRVEDRIMVRLKYVHSFKGGCGDVNETHLAKVKFLGLRRNPSTESAFTLSLRSDDFKGLVNLEELDLADTRLSSLPTGVFAGLASLETLNLNKNRLRSLTTGVFDELTSLETLRLQQNSSLRSLPYDELEALPNLTELRVDPQGRRGYQMAGSERDVELEVEPGGETTYQVRLTHRPTYSPTEQPTLTVSSDAAGVVATPRTLRFTRENWFRRQTVRVVALASADGVTATLSHTSVAVTLDRPIPTVTVRVMTGNSQRALTAQFVSPPQRHDGTKRVKVWVAFSEAVEESPKNVGEHGVRVEGGEVISVRPVVGQAPGKGTRSASGRKGETKDREVVWEFEIEPDSHADVTVSLEAGRACDETGAICTADGRSLSEDISTTVPGPGEAADRGM